MTVRQFLDIVEIRTKAISVSTYLIATLYSLWIGTNVRPGLAILLFVAVICVDMGTTAFNSFFDYMRGVDNKLVTRERDKVLVHEGVAPGHALIVSVSLYLLAAAGGVALAVLTAWWIIPLGAVGLVVGFLYTGGPLPISRTPVGEIFAGGALGSLLFLVVVAVHSGGFEWATLIASLPSTLVIASVLTVNNTCDIQGDREAGRRTLSILIGNRAGEVVVYLLGIASYGLIAFMSIESVATGLRNVAALPAAGLLVAPVGLVATAAEYFRMHRLGYSHDSKQRQMIAITRVVVIYTLAYSVTFVAGLLMR